jgi:hypothetical protein
MEVADQLAQLAHDRDVHGVLVRWPGDLASAISGGGKREESTMREVEEGQLLSPTIERIRGGGGVKSSQPHSDGSMGYMRGRILYLLDKCIASHGHNENSVHSEPLLIEGSRPFALWDTSHHERDWITYHQQQSKLNNPAGPLIPKKMDKYGNSLTEMDLFGRAAIFGNQPPLPQQGKHYYSSKQRYYGYSVSSQFEPGRTADDENGARSSPLLRNENFDSPYDNEGRMNQFQGSLSAMHALYDFTKENLQGRIALPPLWGSTSASASSNRRKEQGGGFDEGLFDTKKRSIRSGLSDATLTAASEKPTADANVNHDDNNNNDSQVSDTSPHVHNKVHNGLATLVQMPKARRRGKQAEAA